MLHGGALLYLPRHESRSMSSKSWGIHGDTRVRYAQVASRIGVAAAITRGFRSLFVVGFFPEIGLNLLSQAVAISFSARLSRFCSTLLSINEWYTA